VVTSGPAVSGAGLFAPAWRCFSPVGTPERYRAPPTPALPQRANRDGTGSDIKTGSAGSATECQATKGWDWPTGLGTPNTAGLVNELADL
jgi:hypothetical protein